jgi:hypothetical protein
MSNPHPGTGDSAANIGENAVDVAKCLVGIAAHGSYGSDAQSYVQGQHYGIFHSRGAVLTLQETHNRCSECTHDIPFQIDSKVEDP